MNITDRKVEAAAEALYDESSPKTSKLVRWEDRSEGSRERYRAFARAALVAANSAQWLESNTDAAAAALYRLMDPKRARETDFASRSHASKERYRELAREALRAAELA